MLRLKMFVRYYLTCDKCGQDSVVCDSRDGAIRAARAEGWCKVDDKHWHCKQCDEEGE